MRPHHALGLAQVRFKLKSRAGVERKELPFPKLTLKPIEVPVQRIKELKGSLSTSNLEECKDKTQFA